MRAKTKQGPRLSREAMELLAQGHKLVLVGLSPQLPHADSGWPSRKGAPETVLAAIAAQWPERADDCADPAMANAFFVGRRKCSRQRLGRKGRGRRGGAMGSSRGRMDKNMLLSLRAFPAGSAGEARAFCVFIAYAFKGRGLRNLLARPTGKKDRQKKHIRQIKSSHVEEIARKRAMKPIRRRQDAREAMGGGQWARSLKACRRAVAAAFMHVEALDAPAPRQLAEWLKKGGLAAAAAYVFADAQARLLQGHAGLSADAPESGEPEAAAQPRRRAGKGQAGDKPKRSNRL